jgi:hypothetical protein
MGLVHRRFDILFIEHRLNKAFSRSNIPNLLTRRIVRYNWTISVNNMDQERMDYLPSIYPSRCIMRDKEIDLLIVHHGVPAKKIFHYPIC